MMTKKNYPIIYFICLLMVASGFSQYAIDARSLGMAGSNAAISEGIEYVGENPATLALARDFSFELHLLSAHFMVKNNSYSLKEYDKYFTTGDSLTARDIDDLLGNIPDDGLRGDFLVGVKTFSFYVRPYSLAITGMGNGFINLPKAPFQLPFLGNKTIKEYRLDDLDGEMWNAAAVNFGFALPVTKYFQDKFDFVSVGLNLKYVIGIGYAGIESTKGHLLTTDEYIIADGRTEVLKSEGGSGLGIDLGFLAQKGERWTFSLHFSNLIGGISWKKNNEKSIFEFSSDTLQLNNADSLEWNDSDTTFSTGNFSTGLPRAMTLAAAYQLKPNLMITAAWRQGLNKSLGNYTTPRISVGTEYKPIPVIPLRAGIALGGQNGFALGLGMGIDLKYWQLNLGYLNHNMRWFRGSRSIDFALTTQFRF